VSPLSKVTRSSASNPGALTGQAEDYLKSIYDLEQSGEAAATTDIAAELGIAAASVSGMIRRLARLGLVKVERYRGARLTPTGRQLALQLLRRHRIIECYLTQRLGYGWDNVHDEAERLEHAASPELIERMAEAMGNPTEDPHGAPIPTAAGRVDERRLKTIADLAVGAKARVVRVSDGDPAFLRYLGALGIRPGASVKVAAKEPFDGPLELVVGRSRHAMGLAAAGRVYIETVGEGRGRR
jgi:DtxR family Mn-dependent transcriptional regulator